MSFYHPKHANVVRQLKEVFPELDQEFLGQFCEGYEEHELLVEEIIEVILSLDIIMSRPASDVPSSSLMVEGPSTSENLAGVGEKDDLLDSAIGQVSIGIPNEMSVMKSNPAEQNDTTFDSCNEVVQEIIDDRYDDVINVQFLFNSNQSSVEYDTGVQSDGNGTDEEYYASYSSGSEEPCSKNPLPTIRGCIPKKLSYVVKERKKLLGSKRSSKPCFCDKIVKKKRGERNMKVTSYTRLSEDGDCSIPKSFRSPQFEKAESKFDLLKKVLPDADNQYLSDQSKLLCDDSSLLVFIAESLDRKDYPKMNPCTEEFPPLMENFECSVEEFLKEIPNPTAVFNNDTYMRSGYERNAEIYLQSRYPNAQKNQLKERLAMYQYNLTRVCLELEEEGEVVSPYCMDFTPLHHQSSIFFHQEVWYIEHRKEIEDYLASVVEAVYTEELMNRPPTPIPQNVREVFECAICADEVEDYNQLGSCDAPSGHLFCFDCIRRQVEIKFAEGDTWFFCLVDRCGGTFPLQTIRDVLSPSLFKRLEDKIHAVQVNAANIPGIENCPFCDYAYCPGAEKLFECRNLDCRQVSCRICKKIDHSPDQCRMFQEEDEETARLMIEERMAQAMIRNCHSCGKGIVKEEGCNKMTCTCGAIMCYLCRRPVVDYKHFNGPGGDNLNRCELFSTEEKVHVAPVLASGQEAFDEIIRNNPGLKLDASLIPK